VRLGAAAAGLALVAACSVVIPPPDAGVPIAEFDTEPRPAQEQNIGQATGPIIEVARGEVDSDAFSFVVHRSAAGACTFLNRESSGSGGCGPLPGDGLREFGPFGIMTTTGGSDLPAEVTGLVSGDVASVRVEMEDGTSAQARLVDLAPAEMDAQAFIAFLPPHASATAVLALDLAGNEVARVPLAGGPVGPDGVQPTPASS